MRAVVLSGGGGKGAYEVGVWKALRKLHIKYDIVTGTSIGALNGAMMTQNSYLRALSMWHNIDFNKIYDVELKNSYATEEGKKEVFKMYKKNILNGGMQVKKIEKLIERYVNIKRFYRSPINYGLVTVNLSKLKAVELTKDQIPKEKLKDYLMASASCFPAFPLKEIDGKKYIDGGYYDNLPIRLAVKMGADEIIAVDLDAIGVKKAFTDKNVKCTYIKPKNSINSFLVFDKFVARRAIKLGYNDTMKAFDKLDGDCYTFKHHALHRNYDLLKDDFLKILTEILKVDQKNIGLPDKIFSILATKNLMDNKMDKRLMKEMNQTIEYLGKVFGIDETKVYTMNQYNSILFAHIVSTKEMSQELVEEKIKNNKIKDLLNSKFIIKYLYNKIMNLEEEDKLELYRLLLVFKKEFMAALYLSVI